MQSILIIEDDKRIHKILRFLLEAEGYTVQSALDGLAGLSTFRARRPSVVILTVKLPKMGAREVLLAIRREVPSQPIIVLSALSEEIDKVVLLELGADDYMTKPFSPIELLASIRAGTRRDEKRPPTESYSFGDILGDFAKMEVTRDHKPVTFTAQEFKLLKFFIENPERVLSRDEILNRAWGYECYPATRTVNKHILRLRQKLEKDSANPAHFRTIHSVGYQFVPIVKSQDGK